MEIIKNKTFKFYFYGLNESGLDVEISEEIDGMECTTIVNSFLENIEYYVTENLKLNISNFYIYFKVNLSEKLRAFTRFQISSSRQRGK